MLVHSDSVCMKFSVLNSKILRRHSVYLRSIGVFIILLLTNNQYKYKYKFRVIAMLSSYFLAH